MNVIFEGKMTNMHTFYSRVALAYFLAATVFLMAIAFLLLGLAAWEVYLGFATGQHVDAALSSASLLVIGFAVIETAKFIGEEEIVRKRELRSSTESRQSITKFVTIIVIAASLEALMMVFKATREDVTLAMFPAALFVASMFALLALGGYQWLSSRINHSDQRGEEGS